MKHSINKYLIKPIHLHLMFLLQFIFLTNYSKAQADYLFGLTPDEISVTESSINTHGAEIGPLIINGVLYFSRENPAESHLFKNENFFNIHSTLMHQSMKPEPDVEIIEDINSDFHNGPLSYCHTTGELYVTQSNYENAILKSGILNKKLVRLKIAVYENVNGSWIYKEEFLYNNPRYSVGHPAISRTGDSLFFVSDMPGGYGKSDIYLCRRVNGQWQEPVNLGAKMNTRRNEITPFVDNKGTLYFASNGHRRGKSFNIYASLPVRHEYQEPKMLSAPMNSRADDYGLHIHENGNIAYFVSNRKRRSKDNIFVATRFNYELKQTELSEAEAEIGSIMKNLNAFSHGQRDTTSHENIHLSDVSFNTSVEIINKEQIPDLKISFSYKLNTDTIKPGTNSYSLSAYNPDESLAVFHLLHLIKQTTENYFSKYLRPGKKISINIHCSPDLIPVFGNVQYQKEFGDTLKGNYYLNNKIVSIVIDNSSTFDDSMLAFLRTYGIRKHMEQEIEALGHTRNHFNHIIYSSEQFEKLDEWVKIEVIIDNAFSNF